MTICVECLHHAMVRWHRPEVAHALWHRHHCHAPDVQQEPVRDPVTGLWEAAVPYCRDINKGDCEHFRAAHGEGTGGQVMRKWTLAIIVVAFTVVGISGALRCQVLGWRLGADMAGMLTIIGQIACITLLPWAWEEEAK